MKKSNKILLGAFAMVLLLLAGRHMAIYARFHSGHGTETAWTTGQEPDMKRHPLDKVTYIQVKNVMVNIHPDKNAAPVMAYSKGKKPGTASNGKATPWCFPPMMMTGTACIPACTSTYRGADIPRQRSRRVCGHRTKDRQ